MKIFDLEVILFRINLITVGVVLVLIAPTTRIIASWYPGRTDLFWLIPVVVLGVSAFLWLLMRLSLPALIRWGIFRERREKPRVEEMPLFQKLWRIVTPIILMVFQVGVLLAMCVSLIAFMRSQTLENFLTELAKGPPPTGTQEIKRAPLGGRVWGEAQESGLSEW